MKLRSIVLVLLGCSGDSNGPQGQPPGDPPGTGEAPLKLEVVASGLSNPVHLTAPAGDARLFIVEKSGRIRIVQNGQLLPTPFLDIASKVSGGNEQGLLSVAFAPNYATTGFFYVNYTDRAGHTQIERYTRGSDPNRADPASAKQIMMVQQPFSNHNGGHILFGPDGMLYIPLGDGGSGGDPLGHGQNQTTLLGDLLRIDVSRGDPYTIPSDNPYVGQSSRRNEIWASGLRNPWRIAFDRTDGVLYIADVGQNAVEEVNAVPATAKGLNYGWNIMEGDRCFSATTCNRSGLTLPVLTYSHSGGACSVTGGIVYRGQRIPEIRGHYFYGEYCAGWVRSFRYANNQVTAEKEWPVGSVGNILSFGEDAAGEMYLLSSNGNVYRFTK